VRGGCDSAFSPLVDSPLLLWDPDTTDGTYIQDLFLFNGAFHLAEDVMNGVQNHMHPVLISLVNTLSGVRWPLGPGNRRRVRTEKPSGHLENDGAVNSDSRFSLQ